MAHYRFAGQIMFAALVTSVFGFQHCADAQSLAPDAKAQTLLPMVVKISATFDVTTKKFGFGFIVGQQGDRVVILTANHVVRDLNPDASADPSPRITFFEDPGRDFVGELQNVYLPANQGDLAVILAPRPSKLTFVSDAQSSATVERGLDVWPAGHFLTWDVPVSPGKVNRVNPADGHIFVEGLDVVRGDSGGPIIAGDGIVGMIVTDSGIAGHLTEALPIGAIQKIVQEQWHYSWQLRAPRKAVSPDQSAGSSLVVSGKAETVCSDLKVLASMSEQDFAAIRKGAPQNDRWDTTASLYGFKSCYVQKLNDTTFLCEGTPLTSEIAAKQLINQAAERTSTCLGPSWQINTFSNVIALNKLSSGVSILYSSIKAFNMPPNPQTYLPTIQVYQHRTVEAPFDPSKAAKKPDGAAYCERLKNVVQSTQSKFNSIVGRRLTSGTRWISRIQLDGWQDCDVTEPDGGPDQRWFSCELSPIASGPAADSLNDEISDDVKLCLGRELGA